MEYTEFKSPVSLQSHVRCFWRMRDPKPAQLAQTIYPDGRCELLVDRAAPMRRWTLDQGWQTQAPCQFAAQLRSAIRLQATGPIDCIGICLQPAASALIVGARLPSMVDDVVDLADIDSAFVAGMHRAARADSDQAIWDGLTQLLLPRIQQSPLDPRIEAAVQSLDDSQGCISVAALAASLDMSLRGLQTRFLATVGLTVKDYGRVQRLQATLRQLDAAAPIAQVAADAGFADQAHATREVQQFTGLTPAKLRRALQAERDGDEALRMAAAFVRGRAQDAH